MTTTPKERLVARIRALLAKTVENGATEAEAMAALAKAQQIMLAHGLDQEAILAEAFVEETFISKRRERGFHWADRFGYGVSVFTGCFASFPGGNRDRICYDGRESDAIFAYWLTDALDAFVTRQVHGYQLEAGGARTQGSQPKRIAGQRDLFGGETPVRYNPETEWSRRQRATDFGLGVCARLNERLLELATEETKARRLAAKAKLERDGAKFARTQKCSLHIGDRSAFEAGRAAGDGAAFNRPVNGGAAPQMIGAA